MELKQTFKAYKLLKENDSTFDNIHYVHDITKFDNHKIEFQMKVFQCFYCNKKAIKYLNRN